MALHRFKVGQQVEFNPSRSHLPTGGRRYEILRLLPSEQGEVSYRVKSKEEPYERIAKETELSRRT